MKNTICIGVVLALSTPGAGSGNQSFTVEQALSQYPPRTYACRRAEGPILIDGRADEEAWKKAEVIHPFWRLYTPDPAQLGGGEARLLWDSRFLYVAVDFRDHDLYAVFTVHDTTVWADDVLEIFLKPLETSTRYYEFHVNPHNTTLDTAYPGRNAGPWTDFISFEANMTTAVQLRGTLNDTTDVDDGWSLEIRLPFAAIDAVQGKTPASGDRWRFALSRYNFSSHLPAEFNGLENSSSIRCLQEGFHTYEQFDFLHFTTEKP